MHVDDEGRLIPVSKARGRKASLTGAGGPDGGRPPSTPPARRCSSATATVWRTLNLWPVRSAAVWASETIHINYVGPVIGNHSGPGTMALFFLGSER